MTDPTRDVLAVQREPTETMTRIGVETLKTENAKDSSLQGGIRRIWCAMYDEAQNAARLSASVAAPESAKVAGEPWAWAVVKDDADSITGKASRTTFNINNRHLAENNAAMIGARVEPVYLATALSRSPQNLEGGQAVPEGWLTIQLQLREDGGLRVQSPDLPGLILSGADADRVMSDVLPAIRALKLDAEGGAR